MTGDARPNILWICTDQQRYDTIHALGYDWANTPNIDRLVGEGIAFTHAYCQNPICTPSRASFLTGMYPSSIRACMNGNDVWADAAPLVTKLLADAGYDCGLAGKLHLAGAAGRVEPRGDDGYRVFHWSHHPRDDWSEGHDYVDWLREQGVDPAEFFDDPALIPPALHQSSWCADMAIDFMREERDQPWLMSVNFYDPHVPFDPPQSYLDRYDPTQMPAPHFAEGDLAAQALLEEVIFQTEPGPPQSLNLADYFGKLGHAALQESASASLAEIKAAYYAMIELIDHNVGRMLDALDRTGQRENTLVIFMSDHGETLGDHGLLLKGCRFYEGLVRVPLIISWPEAFAGGRVSDALVELTDIAPMLLDICGLPHPPRMQGKSLLPLVAGEADLSDHRPHVHCEYYRTLDYLEGDRPGSYGTMIRNRQYKLVAYHGHDRGELFDLVVDPHEFNNLWDDPAYADVRFRLLKQSFDDMARAVDLGPVRTTAY